MTRSRLVRGCRFKAMIEVVYFHLMEEIVQPTGICLYCGRAFVAESPDQKFCPREAKNPRDRNSLCARNYRYHAKKNGARWEEQAQANRFVANRRMDRSAPRGRVRSTSLLSGGGTGRRWVIGGFEEE